MIERKCQQIWIGPKPIPDRERQWCAEMARINPTWKHTLHGNELLARFAADPYVKHLETEARENPKKWAFLSDRLRILLLREDGGIYLDADCQPIRPLDSLPIWDRADLDFVAGLRSPHRKDVALHRAVPMVDNTFLASAKGGKMVSRIASLWSPSAPILDGHGTGVAILEHADYTTVLLNHRHCYSEQIFPETIVMHDTHNLGSWTSQTPKHGTH